MLQRVKKVCKYLIYKDYANNDTELASLLGYTKSSLSQILNGRVPISDKFIDMLCSIDENINKVWIYSDQGTMLINEKMEFNDPGEIYRNSNSLPLVSITAIGGFGGARFCITEKDIKDYYVIPKFKNKKIDFMIEVEGTSMYPNYNSGDIVACKIINEKGFIQWNKAHVIATKNQGIIIKRIKPGTGESFLMVSDNKDFDSFTISHEDIEGIALVVGVIRLE